MASKKNVVRVAGLGDIHCGKVPAATLAGMLGQVNDRADVLVLCGDLTDHGLPDEATALAKVLTGAVRVPVVAVLGNHDYHSGHAADVQRILTEAGVQVLDGDPIEVRGIGFAGVKGFQGGFGRFTLEPWGEDSIKAFVREAVEEALKLESALARLRTAQRIAVLHYAPIQETVEGEPVEIYAFLGCSRLEEPLNRYPVTTVFHGHAHRGKPEGKLRNGVPVYNVALPLLLRSYPDRPPFRIVEVQAGPPSGELEALAAAAATLS
jgi:Icc-related predicted phosphoesterase